MRIDKTRARELLLRAVAIAKSDAPVPSEWEAQAVALRTDAMPATYTPFLLTALLAKATNPQVDALSLKVGRAERGYSARSLAKDVVVPVAHEVGIDLPTGGAEPLNNHPFYTCARVDEMDLSRDSGALGFLLSIAQRVEALDETEALRALAAAVRVGIRNFDGEIVPLVAEARRMGQLLRAVDEFLSENPEGGKRAQAAVAAAMSCVFKNVRTGLVNDPSKRIPGDVVVYGPGEKPLLSVEVRAKPVSRQDAELFRARLQDAGVKKALLVALAAQQRAFRYDAIIDLSTGETAPTLHVVIGPVELLSTAVTWSPLSADKFAAAYPRHMAERLLQVGAPRSTVLRWTRLTYDFEEE